MVGRFCLGRRGVSDCEVTECVPVRVFNHSASLEPASDIFSVLVSDFSVELLCVAGPFLF